MPSEVAGPVRTALWNHLAVSQTNEEAARLDLGNNIPGQAARAKALELQQAAPVRTLLGRAFGVHNEEWAWRTGADDEGKVAKQLDRLGDSWRALHAVPVGERGSDIDHVVIGPAAVFTLNTKNHSHAKVWVAEHALLVNGQKTNHFRNSGYEAARTKKLLSLTCGFGIEVEPVIVVMAAAAITFKGRPPEVPVLLRRQLVKWLSSRPHVLTPEGVEEVFVQARRVTTWH